MLLVTDRLIIPDTRGDTPADRDERETLIAFLDLYRETVLVKLDGLDGEQLSRRLLPSRTTLLGIVKHLIHVEERWFVAAIGGAPMRARNPDDRDAEWLVDEDETAADLATRYRVMWARSNEIARAASLDEHRRRADRPGTDLTVRWILVHMLEETARHAGHADILRELIDGRTGD
jgi:uncharacterized damage-inducible protein DinB